MAALRGVRLGGPGNANPSSARAAPLDMDREPEGALHNRHGSFFVTDEAKN